MHKTLSHPNFLVPYMFIAAILLLANWNHVFGIDFLYTDDSYQYREALTNRHFQRLTWMLEGDLWFNWPKIIPQIRKIIFWEICERSVLGARLLLIFACYIPLSCMLFYLYKKYFHLSSALAFSAAVLPNMLPRQNELPVFMNGNYQVFGFVLAILSFLFALNYLKTNRPSFLIAAVCGYFLAVNSAEQAVFFLPAFLFFFYVQAKTFQSFSFPGLSFTLIAGYQIFIGFFFPRAFAEITKIAGTEQITRFVSFLINSDPVINSYFLPLPLWYLLVCAGLSGTLFIQYYSWSKTKRGLAGAASVPFWKNPVHLVLLALTLCTVLTLLLLQAGAKVTDIRNIHIGCWFAFLFLSGSCCLVLLCKRILPAECGFLLKFQALLKNPTIQNLIFAGLVFAGTSYPFIFHSFGFGVRYTHFAAFGYILAFTILIAVFAENKVSEKTLFCLAGLLLLVTGISRIVYQTKRLEPENSLYRAVRTGILSKKGCPPNSQFAIIGSPRSSPALGGGIWARTDGIVKHITGRMDCTGIMPFEYHFYDPFTAEKGRVWNSDDTRMTGLDLKAPLFVFRLRETENQSSLVQLRFALRWLSDHDPEKWILYQLNPDTGEMAIHTAGKTMTEYEQTLEYLDRQGFSRQDIAWGGYDTNKTVNP